MKVNEDGKTVRAMDVLVPKVGEIIGGSQREDQLDVLEARMKKKGMTDIETYYWYLDIRKYGSVPHSGFGLGFERAIMYITGMQNIRDVLSFPRVPRWAKF
jgi:asparaginyl-tRNA synthetase